jgi:hypothetical protein
MSPQPEPLQQPPASRSLLRRLWQTLPQHRQRQILFDVSRMIAPFHAQRIRLESGIRADRIHRHDRAPRACARERPLILHHNGLFMPHALWALGRARICSRRIIGYWA